MKIKRGLKGEILPVLNSNYETCNQLNLENAKVYYFVKFSVWLEKKEEKSFVAKEITKLIWFLGKSFTTIVPIKNR